MHPELTRRRICKCREGKDMNLTKNFVVVVLGADEAPKHRALLRII